MADKKISQLVDGGAPQATDEFVVDRAGADNFKLDWATLQAAAEANAVLVGDAAGGVLSGTYPNPGFAADMATQAELDAHINDPTDAHLGTAIGNTPAGGVAATTVQGAINELDTDKPATADVVLKSLYDANTVLAADSDNTPAALTMNASTILARLAAGNIKAASVAEIITLLQAYTVGGTDVALADGGTGTSLVDPNADRIMFWDDSAGATAYLTPGTGLTITGTTIDASVGAPTTATYITQTSDAGLSAEQALSALATGIVKVTTGTGVLSSGASLDDLSDTIITSAVAGQRLEFDGTDWRNSLSPPGDGTLPAVAKGHTFTRAIQIGNQTPLASQRLTMVSVWLTKGVAISSITFFSGSTALSVGVNQLFGIYDDNAGTSSGTPRALLRGSADDTSTAWGNLAAKTLNLTSSYTPTRTGQHFIGILINATTVPSLNCSSPGNTSPNGVDPKPVGTSNTGVTALPNPANALSVATVVPYAYWS